MKLYEYLIIFLSLNPEFLMVENVFIPLLCMLVSTKVFKAKFIRLNRSFHHWIGYSLTEVTLELFSYVKARFSA